MISDRVRQAAQSLVDIRRLKVETDYQIVELKIAWLPTLVVHIDGWTDCYLVQQRLGSRRREIEPAIIRISRDALYQIVELMDGGVYRVR